MDPVSGQARSTDLPNPAEDAFQADELREFVSAQVQLANADPASREATIEVDPMTKLTRQLRRRRVVV